MKPVHERRGKAAALLLLPLLACAAVWMIFCGMQKNAAPTNRDAFLQQEFPGQVVWQPPRQTDRGLVFTGQVRLQGCQQDYYLPTFDEHGQGVWLDLHLAAADGDTLYLLPTRVEFPDTPHFELLPQDFGPFQVTGLAADPAMQQLLLQNGPVLTLCNDSGCYLLETEAAA